SHLSEVSHLFSLGMTLLYAVEYSSGNEDGEDSRPEFSEDLNDLLTHLTQNDSEERPSLELVLELCDRALEEASSQEICQNFACVTDEKSPEERGSSSLQSVTEELAAYLQNQTGLVTPGQQTSNSDSDSSKTRSGSSQRASNDTQASNQADRKQESSRNSTQTEDGLLDPPGASGSGVSAEEGTMQSGVSRAQQQPSQSPDMDGPNSVGDDSSAATPRKGRRRQGLLLSDILDVLDRYLHEAELWALCRESIVSLQRKKKHLPAYISLDTLMVRENGCVSYKAIPEDKPLEVIYMAPELQQKGVLNEKTCMYGLGITLRCAAGQKYSSSPLELTVGPAFEELLTSLLQSKPDHRPLLETALLACDEYEKQSSINSKALLQELYMDASALMTSREQKGKSNPLSSETEDSSLRAATDLQLSAFKPITPDAQPSGSAFRPVPVKAKPPKPVSDGSSSRQRYPSAFSSSATHFKPIILHKTDGAEARGGDEAGAEPEDKEKNVVKKLREIKKNLLKHRPPGSLSKDVEIDDSKPPVPVGDQRRTPKGASNGSRKNSGVSESAGTLESLLLQLQSSGQMPETQNLALAIAQHLQAQLGAGVQEKGSGVPQALTQPQAGSAPSMAAATTSETVISTSSSQNATANNPPAISGSNVPLLSSATQAVTSSTQPLPSNTQPLPSNMQPSGAGVMQSPAQPESGTQSQPVTPRDYQSLTQPSPLQQSLNPSVIPQLQGPVQSMNLPPVSQGTFFGQTVSVPMLQYGGGVMSGPVQYQLQQDPRTGLVQLVPVSMVPYGAQPAPSCSPHTLNSDQGFAWPQQYPVSPVGGYNVMEPQLTDSGGVPPRDGGEGSLHRVPSKPSLTGRNAKGLIQKTAAQRARNTVGASASPTGYHSDSNVDAGKFSVYRSHSHHDEDLLAAYSDDNQSKHRRANTSGSKLPTSGAEFVEDRVKREAGNTQGEFQHSGDARYTRTSHSSTRGVSQPYRTNSQSSSPSPSKDSGICLTGNGVMPQAVEASLMERLLSSDSLRHQQILAHVLQILHKGLAHEEHLDNFQGEEVIAEYVVSLAHLKWETFMSAVTEKYTEIYWSRSLLGNLYHAVNGQPPSVAQTSAKTPPATRNKPFTYGDETDAAGEREQRVRRQSEPAFVSTQGDEEGGEPPPRYPESKQIFHSVEEKQQESMSRQRHGVSEEGGDGGSAGGGHSAVRVLANGRYASGPSETSDSTDNESQEKRRRFKKRYELDRNKSTSLHALTGGGNMTLSPESVMHADEVSDTADSRLQEALRNYDPAKNIYQDKMPFSGQAKDRREQDLCTDRNSLYNTNSPTASSYIPSSYHSLPRQSRPQHTHDSQQQQKPRDYWPGGSSPSHSSSATTSQPSSLPGSTNNSTPTNSLGPLRQDVYQRPPRGPSGLPPQGNSRSPNLNNSGAGSNHSYSPALGRKGETDSPVHMRHHNQQLHSKLSSPASREPRELYYGYHRDAETRSPNSAYNPNLSRHSDATSYSPSFGRDGGDTNTRHGKQFTQMNRQLSPSLSEVNNNAHKMTPGRESLHNAVSSPKSSEVSASPSRRSAKPRLAWGQELGEYRKKGQVVYHSAMIQLNMTPEVDRFIHEIDEDNKATIESRLSSVEQEIAVQRKQRRKSQAFYKKLTEPGSKQTKGETKGVISQVLKDMSEMTNKLRFLDLCRTHLQMLLAELYGLDTCFLHTLVSSGGGGAGEPHCLVLQPFLENQLLQFQTVREPSTGCELQVLQAGHPKGLLAYLFTLTALSDGYIHQFLFCFRYFLKAEEVFHFITQKYLAAAKGNQSDVNIVRVQQRAMDLLQFWVEGFYSVDFERNEPLSDKLEAFVMQRVDRGMAGAQNLLNLLYACHLGENTELVGQPDSTDDQDEVYYLHLSAPKRWESFRSLLGRKKDGNKQTPKESPGVPYKDAGGVLVEKRPPSRAESGSTLSLSRRADAAQLMDYAPHRLAEQLTLMEQELFQRTHPVHYLDSKAQGVGVDMSIPSLRTPSMARKKESSGQSSLFIGPQQFESRVSDMISHHQEITHWVSAEILSAGSQKAQVAILTKFLTTAQLCVEIRNFATALAIVAGLDNLLVRQLPAWKHLPAKAASIMEHLETLQVQLKGEQMALMKDKESHMYPTIPCALYFLLHLQQLEIGGFTLANGMYKWAKMRSICQMIDQIRIFREHEYGFEPDYELQSLICRRLHELSDRDLHTVAAAHDNNFRRVTSASAVGLQGTWRRVKASGCLLLIHDYLADDRNLNLFRRGFSSLYQTKAKMTNAGGCLFRIGYYLYSRTCIGYYYHQRDIEKARDKLNGGLHSHLSPFDYGVPMLLDNYAYVITDRRNNKTVVIDPGHAEPVQVVLSEKNIMPDAVLVTHKHWDHSGGNKDMRQQYPGLHVYGSATDSVRDITDSVVDGAELEFGDLRFQAVLTPGHTVGHTVYILSGAPFGVADSVFSGDLLFLSGCGHEYAKENLEFACHVEKENRDAQAKLEWVNSQRNKKLCTCPSTVMEEKKYNPFLRTFEEPLARSLGLLVGDTFKRPDNHARARMLEELRERKDSFNYKL
ncbi:hypothetical protein BaRGS_00029492, partial [Batillaria attramentaria]